MDDNDRLRAGALSRDPFEGTIPFPAPLRPTHGQGRPATQPPSVDQGPPVSPAPPTPSAWATPAERALKLGQWGPPVATGFEVVDTATRGGLRPGLVIVGGAPGAAKTTLGCQLACALAARGVHVAILASDEDPDALLVRIGQNLGFERADLEAGRVETRAALASRLDELPNLMLVDGVDDGATVDAVGEELLRRAGGKPCVLVADSLQTCHSADSDQAENPRTRIDTVVRELKALSRRGLIVVATSELARGAYRSRDTSDRIDDLAAFKESGGVEYGAHLLIVLKSVLGESSLFNATMPKNRWGKKLSFRLALDFDRAVLSEVAIPAGASPDVPFNSTTQLDDDVEAFRKALRQNPGTHGTDKLIALLKIGKTRARAAIRVLETAGEIENRSSKRRPILYLRNPPEVAPSRPAGLGGLDGTNPPARPAPYRGAGSGAGSVAGLRDRMGSDLRGAGLDRDDSDGIAIGGLSLDLDGEVAP